MHTNANGAAFALGLKAGELVEVKSKEEILATLDENSCLDGLPFMPEMFRCCGQRFTVYKRAHKTCDTVFPIRSRRMANAVHLETRCDGAAHGGCEAGCLIFWKEAWLKRVNSDSTGTVRSALGKDSQLEQSKNNDRCTEDDVRRGTTLPNEDGAEPTYVCQSTRLPYATTDLQWWDIRQYIEDYRSGNVGIFTILKGLTYKACYRYKNKGMGIGGLIRWLYDHIPPLWGGTPWPLKRGSIALSQPTPTEILGLQPGELVRVKPYAEILRTVNVKNRNRGMSFDKEMVPYCGGVYRVLKRVNKIISEKTGEMQELKNPCIVLDSVVCQARYSECRLFCPRSIYPYWREIWLERIPEAGVIAAKPMNPRATEQLNGCAAADGAWQAISTTLDEPGPSDVVRQR